MQMDEEIEDMVGDVKYTDSSKSITASNLYTEDFTDSSPDRNNSSGKNTYVLDWDGSDDSGRTHETYKLPDIPIKDSSSSETSERSASVNLQTKTVDESALTLHTKSHEIFTQTSKTIIELATGDGLINVPETNTLETQTSLSSITKDKIQCTIKDIKLPIEEPSQDNDYQHKKEIISEENSNKVDSEPKDLNNDSRAYIVEYASPQKSSKCSTTNSASDSEDSVDSGSEYEEDYSMNDKDLYTNVVHIAEQSGDNSETIKAGDEEINELYQKLSGQINMQINNQQNDLDIRKLRTLTPLTEESVAKSTDETVKKSIRREDEIIISNGLKISAKVIHDNSEDNETEKGFRLPSIQNRSCPNSPRLSILFSINAFNNNDDEAPQHLNESNCNYIKLGDSLKTCSSPPVSSRSESIQLPPIRVEVERGHPTRNGASERRLTLNAQRPPSPRVPICIDERIQELKTNNNSWIRSTSASAPGSESASSNSLSPEGQREDSISERGGNAVCAHTLHRLRSNSWLDVIEALDELPGTLNKYWGCVSEQRIAALIRQVGAHVESPRLAVACGACATLAAILKNTNYTKKPDFYEAVSTLLAKTGSYSKPVRRAANVALDEVVCSVEISDALAAVCTTGVRHKNSLVRCAAARLVVVCAALLAGGRDLLRTRPPKAAAARRHALRALAVLLEDRHNETRKYAERLYAMLRPLENFEAYYLTDVEVSTAASQMRKYDRLLPPVAPEPQMRATATHQHR